MRVDSHLIRFINDSAVRTTTERSGAHMLQQFRSKCGGSLHWRGHPSLMGARFVVSGRQAHSRPAIGSEIIGTDAGDAILVERSL